MQVFYSGKLQAWVAFGVYVLCIIIWALKGEGSIGIFIGFFSYILAFFVFVTVLSVLTRIEERSKWVPSSSAGDIVNWVFIGSAFLIVIASSFVGIHMEKPTSSKEYNQYEEYELLGEVCDEDRFGVEYCWSPSD